MPKFKIPFLSRFRGLFKDKLKPYLVDQKYKVIPAFSLAGTDYWMYDSALEVPTGRFFAAMGVHIEMEQGCNKQFLLDFTSAIEKVLNPPKGKPINLTWIAQMNVNLRERLELMPNEDFIYKFASVIFFDKSESLYSYDYEYAKLKIEKWKAAGGTLDFFSKTPIRELLPVLTMPETDIQTYSIVRKQIEEVHRELLTKVLSENQ